MMDIVVYHSKYVVTFFFQFFCYDRYCCSAHYMTNDFSL